MDIKAATVQLISAVQLTRKSFGDKWVMWEICEIKYSQMGYLAYFIRDPLIIRDYSAGRPVVDV